MKVLGRTIGQSVKDFISNFHSACKIGYENFSKFLIRNFFSPLLQMDTQERPSIFCTTFQMGCESAGTNHQTFAVLDFLSIHFDRIVRQNTQQSMGYQVSSLFSLNRSKKCPCHFPPQFQRYRLKSIQRRSLCFPGIFQPFHKAKYLLLQKQNPKKLKTRNKKISCFKC